MSDTLTNSDIELLLESLNYSRRAFENYEYYPSYEMKCERLDEVAQVQKKLRAIRKVIKSKAKQTT